MAHLEIVGAIVQQLTQDMSTKEILEGGYSQYYVEHGFGVFPTTGSGEAWSAAGIQSKGDPITDLYEDMAAEQKARSTYEYILNLCDDPDVIEPIKFLREREVVHFQRFGEALRIVQDYMDHKKQYFVKPKF